MESISVCKESIFLSGDIYLNYMFDPINEDFSIDFYYYLFELCQKPNLSDKSDKWPIIFQQMHIFLYNCPLLDLSSIYALAQVLAYHSNRMNGDRLQC